MRASRTILAPLLLLLAPLAQHSALAQAVKDLPHPTDYVSDYAHVLSPEVTRQLDMLCGQVDHQAHAQIAVVTVNTIGDEPISDYAVQLEDAWKVGPKSSDRGLIVLLAIQDHKRWIATGYGLEGILPDAKVGEIGRGMVPYLRTNNYDSAISLAVNQMAGIIAADAGVTLQRPMRRMARQQPQAIHLSLGQLIVIGVLLLGVLWIASKRGLLPFLFGMLLGSSFGGGRGGGRGGGGGGGGDDGGDGFSGFGGGSSGGGGAGGDW